MTRAIEWILVYTKSRCEAWCAANLKNQGYEVLAPLARSARGIEPLFARYLFVGYEAGRDTRSVPNTRGVTRIVSFGERPARVPQDVVDEVRSRIGPDGVVVLEASASSALFDLGQRARLRALEKLAAAGFRIRAA